VESSTSRRIQTADGQFQDLDYLLLRDVKPFRNLIYGGSGFKVLEYGGHGHPGFAKHPRAA